MLDGKKTPSPIINKGLHNQRVPRSSKQFAYALFGT